MFINKSTDGKNNICGEQVAKYRKTMKKSQRELADELQLIGLDVDKMQSKGLKPVSGLSPISSLYIYVKF